MTKFKWWFTFAAYALCWLIGTAWWYILLPFRMVQIEFGSMADWGVRNMKRMVAYLPILALAIALPSLAHAADSAANAHDGRDFLFLLFLYFIGFVLFSIDSGIFKNARISDLPQIFGILIMMFTVPFVGGFVAIAGYGSVFTHETDETRVQKVAKYSFFAVAVFIIVFFACFVIPRQACASNETHYYGPKGQYEGRATTNTANPKQQSVYDAKGNYVGRVMTKQDGTTRAYDNHGNYLGRGSTARPYQKK